MINKKMKFKNLELIVYDFDGVMTDNKVFIDSNGNEMVLVNRGDGLAIEELKKIGIKQLILSSEHNLVVSARAKKVDLPFVQGEKNKKLRLEKYCNENDILLENVAYIGNDINDLEAMKTCGFKFCPNDANIGIKSTCDYVLKTNGGDGVIRELYDMLTES